MTVSDSFIFSETFIFNLFQREEYVDIFQDKFTEISDPMFRENIHFACQIFVVKFSLNYLKRYWQSMENKP